MTQKQLADAISIAVEKGDYQQGLSLYENGKIRFGDKFTSDFSVNELRDGAERKAKLKTYPKHFFSNWISALFLSSIIRVDPPKEGVLCENEIIVTAWLRCLRSQWGNVRLLKFKKWIRRTRYESFTVRLVELELAGIKYRFDCSDRYGDFEFPDVFLRELRDRGVCETQTFAVSD